MILSPEKLKEILLEDGIVTPEIWNDIAVFSSRSGIDATDILISKRIISEDYLMGLIARHLRIPRANIRSMSVPPYRILQAIPEKIVFEKRIVPFDRNENVIKVATAKPHDLETLSFLERVTNATIEVYLATEKEIDGALSWYYTLKAEEYKKAIEDIKNELEIGKVQATGEISVINLLNHVISYAVSLRASDIHIEGLEVETLVRFRVDGVLKEVIRLPKQIQGALMARLKILSAMQIDEHNKPQDGRIRFKVGHMDFDIRVAIMPTFYEEKAVLRLLAASFKPASPSDLGLNDANAKKLSGALGKAFGMILSVGPTGSGKTTTLYTALAMINKPEVNIVTLEDPVEYTMQYINQSQVNVQAGLTFATGLRAFLRQDPNIIMVGEIRDAETLEIAIQSALTGHLFMSTLHTNDAASSIPRLLDLGAPKFLVSATLVLVMGQRLVRRICMNCIQSVPISQDETRIIREQLKASGYSDAEVSNYPLQETLYHGMGCVQCGNIGYVGRTGIFEMLDVDNETKDFMLRPDFTLYKFRQYLKKKGFRSMFEDGLEKAFLGATTLDEVLRVVRE